MLIKSFVSSKETYLIRIKLVATFTYLNMSDVLGTRNNRTYTNLEGTQKLHTSDSGLLESVYKEANHPAHHEGLKEVSHHEGGAASCYQASSLNVNVTFSLMYILNLRPSCRQRLL